MAILTKTVQKGDLLKLGGAGPLGALSPLKKLPPATAALTAEGQHLTRDAAVMASVDLLARPGWLVTMRMGAGDWPITELCLCGRSPEKTVAGIRPLPDGQLELLRWDSAGQFADWWCDAHANSSDTPCQNFIPPPCSLEGFVMVLQAIDAYRRALLDSLLAHAPSDQLLLTAEAFNAHCLSGMKAHDIRWLVPAFVSLVPGFGEYRMTGGPESAKAPFDRQFLTTAFHPDTGVPCVGFGEPGQAMGLEFARSWMHAAGLEARLAAPEGSRAVARCFLAPTGVTNHMATFVSIPDGSTQVNHQTLTGKEIQHMLTSFLEQAASASAQMPAAGPAPAPVSAPAPASVPTSPIPAAGPASEVSRPAPAQAMKFCSQCGTKMEQTAGFCPSCGAKQ